MAKFLDKLPEPLEDGEAITKRRDKAAGRKEMWRSLYRDCYRYAMPARETFDWGNSPGQYKNNILYDSTLQEATYTAANTMVALLFPNWQHWAKLAPGGGIDPEEITKEMLQKLQEITTIFFDFLNNSNFPQVSNEVALDLQVGTAALRFDEGTDDENPFIFSSTPLSALEVEEGPNGAIETVFMLRKPTGRNLVRMYEGMSEFDLPMGLQDRIREKPDEEIEIVQATIFEPDTKHYYGVVVDVQTKAIIWRYDFGESSPDIVARASRIAGELYGRGRIMLALSDARTLDKMQEFVLRHSAQQIAPPMTGISDGILNPYTAVLTPNTILPVGSNDTSNPSLRVLDFGGNFAIGDTIMEDLRERIRRTMLGPEPSDGPVKSATEITISDRNRLWAMGGEYGRIQVELLFKVASRGVSILQSRGLAPKFKVNGREVAVKFVSPFARSQDAEDLLALERSIDLITRVDPQGALLMLGLKAEELPEWIAKKTGLDQALVNTEDERKKLKDDAIKTAPIVAEAAEAGVPVG